MLVGIAIEIPFAIGEAVLGVEAYLIRYHPPFYLQIMFSQISDQVPSPIAKQCHHNTIPHFCKICLSQVFDLVHDKSSTVLQ